MLGTQMYLPVVEFLFSLFGIRGWGLQFSSLLSFSLLHSSSRYKLQMEQEKPLLLQMCVQSGSLKPTGALLGKKHTKKTHQKHQKKEKKKKKAVAYILYDPGGFQSLLMMGYSCQFLFLKTIHQAQQPRAFCLGFCFGKLVGKWHFKRSLFFQTQLRVKFFSFPTNEAKWVFQKLVF